MTNNLIEQLRTLLLDHDLDGWLIPPFDEFGHVILEGEASRLKYVTGFTGSNGYLLVLKTQLIFLTDGRYLLQAKSELSSKIEILDLTKPENNLGRLIQNFTDKGVRIGFNSNVLSLYFFEQISNDNFIPLPIDLIDSIWPAKPPIVEQNIFFHICPGQTTAEKLKVVTNFLNENNYGAIIIESLENIAWLLNIRASGLANYPLPLAKLIVSQNSNCLYFASATVSKEIQRYLQEFNIVLKAMDSYNDDLIKLSGSAVYNPREISVSTKLSLPSALQIGNDIINQRRIIKTNSEIAAFKEAHLKDAEAISQFENWFFAELAAERFYTEYQLSQKLKYYRAKQENFVDTSFDSIVGYQENGAIIHYRPEENKSKLVKGRGALLIDSGGHYHEGTTDITRVYAIGKPSYEERRYYTLVLKAHISLASAIFPEGSTGANLDVLARRDLWRLGYDYPHGTGHGVGMCLNVHESPLNISKFGKTILEPGMVVSIEPGYYREGRFGIRLENLYYITSAKYSGFLQFEPLTKVKFSEDYIMYKLLSPDEKQWLEAYQSMCKSTNISAGVK